MLEGTVQRKVKDIALIFHNLIGARAGTHCPRRLHPERRLEIGLRAFQIPQHKDARPRLNRDAGGQLAAGQRDGLGGQRVTHGFLHRLQRIHANARLGSGTDIDVVIVVKAVLLLLQQIVHGVAAGHIGQKPEGMRQHIQQPGIGKRHRRALVLIQLHIVHAGGEIGATN